MLRTAPRGVRRSPAGARGHLRYAAAYQPATFAGRRVFSSRLASPRTGHTWWQRLVDDRDLVGMKLLLLAALLALTALLERAV